MGAILSQICDAVNLPILGATPSAAPCRWHHEHNNPDDIPRPVDHVYGQQAALAQVKQAEDNCAGSTADKPINEVLPFQLEGKETVLQGGKDGQHNHG